MNVPDVHARVDRRGHTPSLRAEPGERSPAERRGYGPQGSEPAGAETQQQSPSCDGTRAHRAARAAGREGRYLPGVDAVPPQFRPGVRGTRRARPDSEAQRVGTVPGSRLIEASLRARGPYSLRLSTRHGSDATRIVAGGVLTAVYEVDGGLELAEARQRPDGSLLVRAPSEEAIERVRFTLGLQDDHSEFVRRFSRDPFLGATVRRLKGLRPLRCATVTHALLRALCGQLITARRAREIERRVVRAATPSLDGLHAAPTPAIMGRYSPA